MAERAFRKYRRLFEVLVLHHYWLDQGSTMFDLMDQKDREQRLMAYDVRRFLAVAPTPSTAKKLTGLGLVYKSTSLGFIVAAPDGIIVPRDSIFQFVATVQSQALFNYTALSLQPRRICEIYYEPEEKIYRYKENVPVLSNLTGASRGSGSDRGLFLSREFSPPDQKDKAEWLVKMPSGALVQLGGDQPGASTHELGSQADNMPVFVSQLDAPAITPPHGLAGAPPRGLLLSADIPDDVFALISLAPRRAGNSAFSFTDSHGLRKHPHPVYQIRFKNRSTIWRYIDSKAGGHTDSQRPLPMTCFGNAGSKQKPSGSPITAKIANGKIVQLVSEIYV